MTEHLDEVELQILGAVRDQTLPTNDVALADVTGLDRGVVRETLLRLGESHLRVTPHHDGDVSDRVEVSGFRAVGGLTRPLVDD